jgi:hypothetical protein
MRAHRNAPADMGTVKRGVEVGEDRLFPARNRVNNDMDVVELQI